MPRYSEKKILSDSWKLTTSLATLYRYILKIATLLL